MVLEGLNRLDLYLAAQELSQLIYKEVLPNLPSDEKYNLTSQIRRAASSIPANIAEGYGRYYYQESIRFCYLARGSLMELSSHIDLAFSQGYLQNATKSTCDQKMTALLKLIHGYINFLRKNKRGVDEPGSQRISDSTINYQQEYKDHEEF